MSEAPDHVSVGRLLDVGNHHSFSPGPNATLVVPSLSFLFGVRRFSAADAGERPVASSSPCLASKAIKLLELGSLDKVPIIDNIATHMKTTIEISDGLLNEARDAAETRGTTLRALVEAGLRRVLSEQTTPFRLRRATFSGQGLQPGVSEGDWTIVRELSYEGRGE